MALERLSTVQQQYATLKADYERLTDVHCALVETHHKLDHEYLNYRRSMERVKRPVNVDGEKTAFDLSEVRSGWFGAHRGGWNYVMTGFSRFADNPQGVFLEPFVERRFFWHPDREIAGQPYERPWVGFLHCPPHIPEYFPQMSPEALFALPQFQASLADCRGLFVLSSYLRDYLRQAPIWGDFGPCPIEVVMHPFEPCERPFELSRFRANQRPQVLQVGTWLRNLASIYKLQLPASLSKTLLLPESEDTRKILVTQMELLKVTELESGTVRLVDFQENDQYDQLLSENLVFLDLFDASATNVVLECIVRNTPLFVRKLPAVVEYLGPDYPCYFESLEQAGWLLQDPDKVVAAHNYLRTMSKGRFTMDAFLHSILDSSLYRSLI